MVAKKLKLQTDEKVPFLQRLLMFAVVQLIIAGIPFMIILWLATMENSFTIIMRWALGIWVAYSISDGLISLFGGASETKDWRLRHKIRIWLIAFVLNFPIQILVAYLVIG